MRWPRFISRKSHEEIRAADRELIATLKQQIVEAEARHQADRASLEGIANTAIEAMKPQPISVDPRIRRRPVDEAPAAEPKAIDLTLVDPSDTAALLLLAKREMPIGHKGNMVTLQRNMVHLRDQVILAHQRKQKEAATPGFIPTRVSARIDEAESAGKQEALQTVAVA